MPGSSQPHKIAREGFGMEPRIFPVRLGFLRVSFLIGLGLLERPGEELFVSVVRQNNRKSAWLFSDTVELSQYFLSP